MNKCLVFLLFISVDLQSQMVIKDTNVINKLYYLKNDSMALCKLPDTLNYEKEKVYLFESTIQNGRVLVSYPNGKAIWENLVFTGWKNEHLCYAGYLLPRGKIKIDSVFISNITDVLDTNDTCALYFVKRNLDVIFSAIKSKCSKYQFKIDSLITNNSKINQEIKHKIDQSTYDKCIQKRDELCINLNNAIIYAKSLDSVNLNYINEINNQYNNIHPCLS